MEGNLLMVNIDIGFVIDDRYVKYCSVVIASILKNSKADENFTFYILNDGLISAQNKNKLNKLKKIKNFKVKWVTVNITLFKNQKTNLREDITIATNYRFVLSSVLPKVDKILLLDADLIIVNNLSEIWNTDINNYYMACCPSPSEIKEYQKSLDISENYKYCNTGVVLANLKEWRKDNIEEQFFFNAKRILEICKRL